MKKSIRALWVLLLCCLPALSAQAIDIKGDIMKVPATVGEFHLTDQAGNPFTQKDLQGSWNLIYFGFTSCPHICPVHMLQLSKFYRELEALPAEDKDLPRVIFVSVDPARDTVAKVKTYVQGFHPDFIGLTGDETEIEKLEQFMKAQHKANVAINGNYQVDHSSLVYLVNGQQQLVASFYPPFYIDGLVKDYLAVIDSETPTVSLNQHSASTPQLPSI